MEIERLRLGMYQSNCYIVNEEGKAFIVDPGDNGEELNDYLKNKDLSLEFILLTHGHVDHVGGVDVLKSYHDVPVYISKEDKEAIIEGIRVFGEVNSEMTEIDESTTIKFINHEIKVLKTPGHTLGGVCFYIEDEGILFSGDTIFKHNVGRYDLYGGDGEALLKGIKEKIFVLPNETVIYPGHDMETTVEHEKKYNMFLK